MYTRVLKQSEIIDTNKDVQATWKVEGDDL